MSAQIQNIAIIGAGLGGLGLALALQSNGIACTVYEQGPEAGRFSGAIMLSPNSIKILDAYGVYDRIRAKGFEFESAELKNPAGGTTDRYFFGSKKLFGYKALRIHRKVLVNILQGIVRERGVMIKFDTKYSHIVSEADDGVTFAFANGLEATASLLVGSDGIHSRVRSYVAPGFEPKYIGIVAIVGAVERSKLNIPENEPIAGPLMYGGKLGMVILAPQNSDGSEIMAGTQIQRPAMDREGWAKFAADKDELHSILMRHKDSESEIVRTAVEGIDMDTVYIWPQHTLPHLPRWTSTGGKVVVIADAAHSIPPTTGQGGGQAFEDGYSLALLLSGLPEGTDIPNAISRWQKVREARVDQLLELTSKINNMRLPKEEQEKLDKNEIWRDEEQGKGEGGPMAWLFKPSLKEEVQMLIKELART